MNGSKVHDLFTIGHSDHDLERFTALLQQHEIGAVADVRSNPYSRFHPQYNREGLAAALKRSGVHYVFLGKELGARRSEPESYQGRTARYDLIARLPAFREGLERVKRGLATYRVALMCAEKDPITCHRTVLVCRHLRGEAFRIVHILEDGRLETMEEAEARLLAETDLPPSSLFQDRAELVATAYERQGAKIAYTEAAEESRGGAA